MESRPSLPLSPAARRAEALSHVVSCQLGGGRGKDERGEDGRQSAALVEAIQHGDGAPRAVLPAEAHRAGGAGEKFGDGDELRVVLVDEKQEFRTGDFVEHIFEVEKDSCSGGEATGFLRMDDVFFDG